MTKMKTTQKKEEKTFESFHNFSLQNSEKNLKQLLLQNKRRTKDPKLIFFIVKLNLVSLNVFKKVSFFITNFTRLRYSLEVRR